MKGIHLLAIIVGVLVDIAATQVLMTKLVILFILTHQITPRELHHPNEIDPTVFLVPGSMLGAVGTFLGGFITGRMAKHDFIEHAILMGLVSTLAGLVIASWVSWPYVIVELCLTVTAAIVGGYLALRLAREEQESPAFKR